MHRQRGFTLIEVVITVGIVSIVTAGSFSLAQSARSAAVATAALRFDTLLDAARTTAHEFDRGATIVFARDAAGDGFSARLYRNRPATGPLVATTFPLLEARVGVSESEVLGAPGFALTIHGDGALAGITGYTAASSAAAETGCPAAGAFHLVFAYGGAQKDRYLPCRINLAANGPVTYMTPPTAPPQAPPTITPCIDGTCNTRPIAPANSATCPPSYVASSTVGQCVPTIVAVPSATPAPTGSHRLKQYICDEQNPPRTFGTDIGLDADGVDEDLSNGSWCGRGAPVPSQAPVARLVETQSWSAFSGGRNTASTLIDSEFFLLSDDGTAALGAPSLGTAWACSSPVQVVAPPSVTSWAGFYRATTLADAASLNTLSTRWSELYQEVNDTGGDGYLVITSDAACLPAVHA